MGSRARCKDKGASRPTRRGAPKPRNSANVVERPSSLPLSEGDGSRPPSCRRVADRSSSGKSSSGSSPTSIIVTDDWPAYNGLERHYISHSRINHSAGWYVQGDTHTNTVEGFFGHCEPSHPRAPTARCPTAGSRAISTSSCGAATLGWSRTRCSSSYCSAPPSSGRTERSGAISLRRSRSTSSRFGTGISAPAGVVCVGFGSCASAI